MIARRCRCGVTYADRCPDRGEPGHYPDVPVAPLLAILLAVLVVLGASAYGAAKMIGVI